MRGPTCPPGARGWEASIPSRSLRSLRSDNGRESETKRALACPAPGWRSQQPQKSPPPDSACRSKKWIGYPPMARQHLCRQGVRGQAAARLGPRGAANEANGSKHQPLGVARHLQVAPAHALAVAVEQVRQAFPVHRAGALAAVEFLRVDHGPDGVDLRRRADAPL